MKEITRIHIAKIAYDIEPAAKKAIEEYISALEQYADDPELLVDIEIRMTELLAEHGVQAGGVITAEDVAAVRGQLGEPSDFLLDDASDMTAQSELDGPKRRLYRDTDNALFGGVLAGIARYFGIDSLWTRLLFLVLLFVSFGTVVLLYIVLWLIVPPAVTAAEKLRMAGQSVTLASIKLLGEQDAGANASARIVRRVLISGVGVLLLVAAVGALLATASVAAGFTYGLSDQTISQQLVSRWWLLASFSLFAVAGLLLAALCTILAIAVFRRQWNKRLRVAIIAIIVTGMLAFGAGAGIAWYGSWQDGIQVNGLRKTSHSSLPAQFSTVKSISVTGDEQTINSINVEYIVDAKPRYVVDAMPGVTPRIELNDDGTAATVFVATSQHQSLPYGNMPTSLKIYGPALEFIEVNGGFIQYRTVAKQDTLTVSANAGHASLVGSYKTVRANTKDAATISLDEATIEDLVATMAGGDIAAGVVRTLSATQPEACPANTAGVTSALRVQSVADATLLYNGTERATGTIKQDCGYVRIGDLREFEEDAE